MAQFGKFLMIVGFLLILLGAIFAFQIKIPYLGKLPGDIRIERENFRFYFPITTSLLLSAILSFLLSLFSKK